MPVNTPTLYRPSGKLGSIPILAPMLLFIGVPLLSVAYAYIDAYLMMVKVKVVISVLYAFAVMGLVVLVCIQGRCRNPMATAGIALAAGLIGLYIAWVVFSYALMDRWERGTSVRIFDVLINPSQLWTFIRYVAENGWFVYDDHDVKGGLLWAIWAFEAGLILAIPVFGTMKVMNDRLFCEECGHWTKKISSRATFAPPEDPLARRALQVGSVMPLEMLQPVDPSVSPQFALDTWDCEKCGQTHAFQIRHAWQKSSSKGKVMLIQQTFTEIYLLDPESHRQLAAVCANQVELPDAAEEEVPVQPQDT